MHGRAPALRRATSLRLTESTTYSLPLSATTCRSNVRPSPLNFSFCQGARDYFQTRNGLYPVWEPPALERFAFTRKGLGLMRNPNLQPKPVSERLKKMNTSDLVIWLSCGARV